jgi:hypothetical protein
MTGSAFSLSALFAAGDFEVTDGATRHFFCPHCMSWMFTRPEGADLFDDPSGLEPYMETMTAERLPWVSTPAVEGFEGFPQPAEYGRLMGAYAARAAG